MTQNAANTATGSKERPSLFEDLPIAPPDPIFDLTDRFKRDPNPRKVNLGVGVYQNEQGQTPFLEVVEKARVMVNQKIPLAGYQPIDGNASYNRLVGGLIFGEPINSGSQCVCVQTPGGTGALRVGAEFYRHYLGASVAWVSKPTWVNHGKILEAAGLKVEEYPYLGSDGLTLDFELMKTALRRMPARSVVLLHACCHNPTGVDLTLDQWREVLEIVREGGLLPFFDFAYQGFASGIDEDAAPVRMFAAEGVEFIAAYSLSKNFSMYGERLGALAVATGSAERAERVLADVKATIRAMYSNPPTYSSKLVVAILEDTALRAEWEANVTAMRDRIKKMRHRLVNGLAARGINLPHILGQNGMFSFSGLGASHAEKLEREHSVYMVKSGRICVAALNEGNIEYVCDAVADVAR